MTMKYFIGSSWKPYKKPDWGAAVGMLGSPGIVLSPAAPSFAVEVKLALNVGTANICTHLPYK